MFVLNAVKEKRYLIKLKNAVIINEQDLIKFLKENLKVEIWCDYDGCGSPQVNVSVILCNKEIHSSSDYLLKVD